MVNRFVLCSVLCFKISRFNLTKFEDKEEWKNNFFQGIPSPAGGCLILLPLIFELSNFSNLMSLKVITPYLNYNSFITFNFKITYLLF